MPDAIMVIEDGFEDSEALYPYYRLQEAGYDVTVAGKGSSQTVTGKHGLPLTTDKKVSKVHGDKADIVVVPGGQAPDRMRMDKEFVRVVKEAADGDTILAAICHAGQLLVEADVVRGKRLTSWPSVRKDLENAGAQWVDEEVVVDGLLVTSRKPDDLPAWMRETLQVAQTVTV